MTPTAESKDPMWIAGQLAAEMREFLDAELLYDNNPTASFEKLAEQFYDETHMMAPGKSVPLEMPTPGDEERQQAWRAWTQKRRRQRWERWEQLLTIAACLEDPDAHR